MTHKRIKSFVHKGAFLVLLFVAATGSLATGLPATAEDLRHSSVTGFFGLDNEGMPIVDRHGIMLVFDGPIAPETASVTTFEVWLTETARAEVVQTTVNGAFVFLRLKDELASDANPVVQIAEGEEVEDLAGNSTNRRKMGAVRISDGIAPRLTVTLSGGSGVGRGDEGPERLTKDSIDIRVTSDEPLRGAPRVIVVCESLSWTEMDDDGNVERDIDDFFANRNGAFARKPLEPPGTSYTCGYDADDDGTDDPFELTEDIASARSGEAWEYAWRNPTGITRNIRDGQLAVVAFGRDRSRYERFGKTVSNWATGTNDLSLDTKFGRGFDFGDIRVHPPDGSTVREERPFVLIEFPETTMVTLDSVLLDGFEINDDFEKLTGNEFVYWPLSMNRGRHKVDIQASDAAGNTVRFDFGFETVQRGDYVLNLLAGWNAVSLPAEPIDPSIEAVFTEPRVEVVIAWDGANPERPWSVAVRNGEKWEPTAAFAALTQIRGGTGYWVKSTEFTKQPVALRPYAAASEPGLVDGWNFVGVADHSGNQTENHHGKVLRNEEGNPVHAVEYLDDYDVAYTWDPIVGQFELLSPMASMSIGDGVWVYYAEF